MDAAFENGPNGPRQFDPIVRNKAGNDPAPLAARESARRIERGPRRSDTDAPGPQAPKP